MITRWRLSLAAIAFGALALRVIALDFGLPAVHNPDEIAILSRALAFAKGDPNPHNFLYPTFFFYVLFAWIGGAFVLARVTGQIASLSAFQQRFFVDPSSIYLAGRALGAVCGALSTCVTAILGRTLFDRPTGLAAAALLAVAPVAVMDAHYVKHDVPATLAIVVALWRLALLLARGRRDRPRAGARPRPRRCRLRRRVVDPLLLGIPRAAAGRDGGRRAPARGMGRRRHDLGRGRGHRRRHLLRAVAVSAGRTGDGMARHRGQPSDRRRSRHLSRLVRKPVSVRGVAGRHRRDLTRCRGQRHRHRAPDRDRPQARSAPVVVSRAVPALHRQHGTCEPLSQSGAPDSSPLPRQSPSGACPRCWPRDVRAGCWPC